jgi:tetratricopeptide (TPR) repeat protein
VGVALASDQEYDLADAAFREGLALAKDLGGVYENNLLHFLGDVNLHMGDRSKAKMIYEESVRVLRAKGNKSFLAYPLRRLGYLALGESNQAKALEYFQESLAFNTEIGDKRAVAASLLSLAALALELGKPELAARLFGVVENRLESLSVNLFDTDQEQFERIRVELPDHLEEAALTYAFNEGWDMGEYQVNELVTENFQ